MESIFADLRSALAAGSLLSSLTAILLAYAGGILSSFTPCIYPMIPITIGLIGGAREKSVRDGWVLSSFYVIGMSCVYAVLGVVAGISGKIFGTLTNTPGWYLFVGIILFISALWMMDVIKFDPNVWISRRFRGKHSHHGPHHEGTIAGAFLLGITSGFIAAPCTTPVLTAILSFIATERSVVFGLLLMFAFAMGLGTILVVIGTFAGALKILPRSGKWLQWVKVASGLLILALGGYFFYKAGSVA